MSIATTRDDCDSPAVMSAAFILEAIRANYPQAAIVPELTIEDFDLPDSGEVLEQNYMSGGQPLA